MTSRDHQTPPEGFQRGDADASDSIELPVVVLGESVEESREAPRVRLLQGRIHERWVLYPIYLLDLLACGMAMRFASSTEEWSALPVGLAWILLYIWNWFYGVAYRYRRRVLKYGSVVVILGMTVALVFFTLERAPAQRAMVAAAEVAERPEAPILYWVAAMTVLAASLLIAHIAVLGRGYRGKQVAS